MASRSNSPAPPAKRQKVSDDSVPALENAIEKRVGIIEFLNGDLPGFSGVLKQRYTDFLVNEIDPSGNVVHLTTVGVQKTKQPKPEVPSVPAEVKVEEKPAEPEVEAEFSLKDEDRQFLLTVLSDESLKELLEVHDSLSTPKEAKNTAEIKSLPLSEKAQRSKLHQTLRQVFNSKFDSKTEDDGTVVISVMKGQGRGGRNGRDGNNSRSQRKTREERYPNGEYLHFTLWKENRDTMEVLSQFGRILNLPFQSRNKTFSFAGTKDRRAVTVQRCSGLRIDPARLSAVNRPSKGQSFVAWRVGDFEYREKQLELGDLKGNQFTITLRKARLLNQETTKAALAEVVAAGAKALEQDGFINYFGLQRFGTFNKGTHDVGRKILQSDWHGAIMEIMDYDTKALTDDTIGRDDRDRARALEIFFSGDFERYGEALRIVPRKFVAENSIIQQAQKAKLDPRSTAGDWHSALLSIPRKLRSIYAHSYQSYVWNNVASERIRRFGKKVIKGDLVLSESADPTVELLDQDGDPIVADAATAREYTRARPLSHEEAESGQFSLQDVLISTPGYDIEYPDNKIADVYKEIMSKDNLDPLAMRRLQKDFSLSGSYRSLIGKVIGTVETEVLELGQDEQAVETDLDIIKKADPKSNQAPKQEDGSPKELAVVVKFKLGTSMYATVALRELMKAGGLETYTPDFFKARGTGGANVTSANAIVVKSADTEMEG